MNTLELKELKEIAQYREECGASMTVNPKVVLDLISNLESAVAINTDAAIAEIKAQGVDEFSSEIGKLCDELKLGSMSWKAAKSIVMRAVTFAANLRAGRKG